MVYGKTGTFFIWIKIRLKKTVSLMVQNVVHINIVIKRAIVVYCNLAHKRSIARFCSGIFFRYKIVQFNGERKFVYF